MLCIIHIMSMARSLESLQLAVHPNSRERFNNGCSNQTMYNNYYYVDTINHDNNLIIINISPFFWLGMLKFYDFRTRLAIA